MLEALINTSVIVQDPEDVQLIDSAGYFAMVVRLGRQEGMVSIFLDREAAERLRDLANAHLSTLPV